MPLYCLRKNTSLLQMKPGVWNPSNISETTIATAKKPLEVSELRMDKTQFEIWLKESKIFKLFFDGALKGNSGAARGG